MKPRPYHDTILDLPPGLVAHLTAAQFDEWNLDEGCVGLAREIVPGCTYAHTKLALYPVLVLDVTDEEITAALAPLREA